MKKIFLIASAVVLGSTAFAQNAFDAYRLSQPDLKGTARFMGMAGAFTALGGDLSCISQNPGGLGIYRSSEVGLTLDLDIQRATSTTNLGKTQIEQTKFLLNNIGFVWTLKLPSATCPNVNFGFTYNKTASFNRRYQGAMKFTNSLSNLVAQDATFHGYSETELFDGNPNYDPYYPYYGNGAEWIPILAYNSFLINPIENTDNKYTGQWNDSSNPETQTKGVGYFDVLESGAVDSYNIAIGGNISDILYWGMDFDINHINYNLNPVWEENLSNAKLPTDNGFEYMNANWALQNWYNYRGTGFNYKLGFIIKPIQELRLGFSFHTPTWYGLTETFSGRILYNYEGETGESNSNYNTPGYNNFNFTTPWRINAGIAGVLFDRLIVSADYEWTQYSSMKFSQATIGWDYWDDPYYDPYYDSYDYPYIENGNVYYNESNYSSPNKSIKTYYKSTNTFRVGAEFRILPKLSVRAGYSYVSSPVKADVKNDKNIHLYGTMPNYRLDNSTNYITAGLGYRTGGFYIDASYVYKHMNSEYFAYPTNNSNVPLSPTANLSLNNSQIVLSAGYKF